MTSRKHWLTDLLLLSGSVGSFYAYKLGERALWSPGEGRYSEIAREMLASGNYLTPQLVGVSFFDKPPFFIWLETLSIKLFGLNEWALRLWPALLAVVGCLIVYIAGRKLFGRSSGVISAYVLATSGLWYGIGHLVSLDMTLSVLMS
ncbi:MAG: ArnT family glycosyltransferase, partial [Chloroflexota bacterium]